MVKGDRRGLGAAGLDVPVRESASGIGHSHGPCPVRGPWAGEPRLERQETS